jgi:hypothetical protein
VKGSWRKGRCCSAALPLSPVLPGRTRGESIKRGAEERMEERKACANLGRSFGQGMSISKPSGKVDDVSLNPAQPQTNYCSSLFLPSSIPLPSLFRPSSVPLPSLFRPSSFFGKCRRMMERIKRDEPVVRARLCAFVCSCCTRARERERERESGTWSPKSEGNPIRRYAKTCSRRSTSKVPKGVPRRRGKTVEAVSRPEVRSLVFPRLSVSLPLSALFDISLLIP